MEMSNEKIFSVLENLYDAATVHQRVLEQHEKELVKIKKLYHKQRRMSVLNTVVTISAVAYVALVTQIVMYQDMKISNMDRMLDSLKRNQQTNGGSKPEEK